MNEPVIAISVVICSYNRANYIYEAMDSLYNQSFSKSAYEVIVVDNNSTDNTADVCDQFIATHNDAHFYYLTEPNQGASFARNTGAKMAKGNLLCFMDDDAIAHSQYLEKIDAFFKQYPSAGGLGGRIVPRYIPEEPEWMSHFVSSLVGNFNYSNEVTIFSPNKYPLESNMIIRKNDFDAVNGFNTALPGVKGTLRIGGEGKEFFLKLKAIGKIIYYDPAIMVEHIVETKKLTKEYLYRVASGIGRGERVRTKQINEWSFIKKMIEYFLKLGASLVLAFIYLCKGQFAKMMPVIQFRIDALKGLLNH